jgi:hypothetical protein
MRYFEHLSTLAFADTPDYAYLKALFRDLFRKLGFTYEAVLYDWEVLAQQQQQQQQRSQQPQSGSTKQPQVQRRPR